MGNAALPLIFGALGGIQGGAESLQNQARKEAEEERKIGFQRLMQQYQRENMDYQNQMNRTNLAEDRKYQEGVKASDREYAEGQDIVKRGRELTDYERKLTDKREDDATQHGFRKSEASYAASLREPTEFDKKIKMLDDMVARGEITAEEKKNYILRSGGYQAINDRMPLSEGQKVEAIKTLAELKKDGVNEENIEQINMLHRLLGYPELSPEEKDVPEKGIKGLLGGTKKETKYKPKAKGLISDESEDQGEDLPSLPRDKGQRKVGQRYYAPNGAIVIWDGKGVKAE